MRELLILHLLAFLVHCSWAKPLQTTATSVSARFQAISNFREAPPAATTQANSDHRPTIGVVIGLAVLFVVVLIISIIVCICRRRRSSSMSRDNNGTTSGLSTPSNSSSIQMGEEKTQKTSNKSTASLVDRTQQESQGTVKEKEIKKPSNRKTKKSKLDRKKSIENEKKRKKIVLIPGKEYWNGNSSKMLAEIIKNSKPTTIEINEAVFGYSDDPADAPCLQLQHFPHTEETMAAEKQAQQTETNMTKAVFENTQGSPGKSKERSPNSVVQGPTQSVGQSPGQSTAKSAVQSTQESIVDSNMEVS